MSQIMGCLGNKLVRKIQLWKADSMNKFNILTTLVVKFHADVTRDSGNKIGKFHYVCGAIN